MVGGAPAEVLDASAGRLVITPHPVLLDGQRNISAELLPGESLADFLRRHVPDIESGAWSVSIGGLEVPRALWRRTYPKHGQLISCRASVHKSVVQIVAVAALAYFTFGAGWTLGATMLGINGLAAVGATGAFLLNAGIFIAGSALINKVLAPKVPGAPGSAPAAADVYSLRSQRNAARAYAPIGTLLGEMRVTPDLAGQPYTWFEGDDQYLSTILLGGINVASYADLAVGETPLSSYEDVTVYTNGFSGMSSQDVPLFSNVDSIAGGELGDSTAWVTRTGSTDTVQLQLDFEYQLYNQRGEGSPSLTIVAEYRAVGSPTWTPLRTETVRNKTTEIRRMTWTQDVTKGQYEVRARRLDGPNEENVTRTVQWVTLRSVQPDETDYSGWGRIGIRIKATGQLNGSLDTVRATFKPRPLPLWNGSAWANATTRPGVSNPGAIILQVLRGIWDGDVLQFGYGLSDDQIDVEGLKGFMLHCTAMGFTYDRWITENISLGALLDEIALAGMGQFMWLDGSRPTVMWAADDQPIGGVVNMANMTRGSFSVNYQLAEAADGIEYQYVDRDRNFETTTLRVMAPGVTTMLKPARITGQGVTSEAHAAVLARYHLAQSLYQYKDIAFGTDIERLDYRRLSMLSLSHDMTQWGYGGRLADAEIVGGQIVLTLDEPVPSLPSRFVGLRVPGEQSYRVFSVQAFTGPSAVITLTGAWPSGVAFPGDSEDNPAHDTLWCYDVKATPGYRVRVVSIEPDSDLKGATVRVVPESSEFWDYVQTGTYVPAPSESLIPELDAPAVLNIRVTQQVNRQGDTEWVQLNVVWDSTGDLDHCQVWAAIDGQPLVLVDGRAVGNRSSFRIDENGDWLVQVRPFASNGKGGTAASVLFVADAIDRPPVNVDVFDVEEVDGGLRRYSFGYSSATTRPSAYAGVQIRYRENETEDDPPVTVDDWATMTPLGTATDVYTQANESTLPAVGIWTFACRAISTSGVLSSTLIQVTRTLGETFSDILTPDETPAPTPTGVVVTPGFARLVVQHDEPTYTVGHGHAKTRVYGVLYAGGAEPVISSASLMGEFIGNIGSVAVELGQVWRIWVKWVTVDGVESETAAGGSGTNGIAVTIGKIGNSDLGPLIIEAGNIANGVLTPTKFASGIEPVTIVTTLPTVKSTTTIFYNGVLYYWDNGAGAYLPTTAVATSINAEDIIGQLQAGQIAALEASKITGQLTNAQLAAIAAAKITGQLTNSQIADLAASKLTGQISETQITDGAISTPKLAAGSVTTAKLVAGAVTANEVAAGAITTTKLAAGAVTANEIAAGSITTAKIAAGAITATELAAGSVTTAKIVAGAITSNELAAGSVVAGKIAALSITSAEIAAGTITGNKIAANTITAGLIQAGAIGASEIAAGAISATKLAAGAIAVGTAAIQDGAITNAMIANLNADKIVASSLSAVSTNTGSLNVSGQLAIGASGYINGNGAGFESGAGFYLNAQSFSVGQSGAYLSYSTSTGLFKTGNIQMNGLLTTPGKDDWSTGTGIMIGRWPTNGHAYFAVTHSNGNGLRFTTDGGVLYMNGAVISGGQVSHTAMPVAEISKSVNGNTASGARVEITSNRISIYNSSNAERVRLSA